MPAPKTTDTPSPGENKKKKFNKFAAMARLGGGAKKSDKGAKITQFAGAKTSYKPIALFIYTTDMSKKAERARAACSKYLSDVLPNAEVGNELVNFVRIKMNLSAVSKEIRKKYRIGYFAPQLLIYDCNGRLMYRTRTTDTKQLASMLKRALAKTRAIRARELRTK